MRNSDFTVSQKKEEDGKLRKATRTKSGYERDIPQSNESRLA
jgi:hypothetical protein